MGATQTWWFLARSTGIVAWIAATASVLVGLVLTTHGVGRTGRRPWTVDVHRVFSGLAGILVLLHLVAIIADSYEHFTLVDALVPYSSSWRSGAVAWGVIAMYVLGIVEISSLVRQRLSHRVWRGIHQLSFALFWLISAHAFYAGTDGRNPVVVGLGVISAGAVAYLTGRRVFRYGAVSESRIPTKARWSSWTHEDNG